MPRDRELEQNFIALKDSESELAYANRQVNHLWHLVHTLVEATRTDKEMNSPTVYSLYDTLCEQYGETPREPRILDDGLPGKTERF